MKINNQIIKIFDKYNKRLMQEYNTQMLITNIDVDSNVIKILVFVKCKKVIPDKVKKIIRNMKKEIVRQSNFKNIFVKYKKRGCG